MNKDLFEFLKTKKHRFSSRYKQLGNAVAVPVVEWIAKRIVKIEENNNDSN